jgi:hypothetical protein
MTPAYALPHATSMKLRKRVRAPHGSKPDVPYVKGLQVQLHPMKETPPFVTDSVFKKQ